MSSPGTEVYYTATTKRRPPLKWRTLLPLMVIFFLWAARNYFKPPTEVAQTDRPFPEDAVILAETHSHLHDCGPHAPSAFTNLYLCFANVLILDQVHARWIVFDIDLSFTLRRIAKNYRLPGEPSDGNFFENRKEILPLKNWGITESSFISLPTWMDPVPSG